MGVSLDKAALHPGTEAAERRFSRLLGTSNASYSINALVILDAPGV
jgi:hypothetical protein